jgi:hypothetical protein
MCSAEIFGYDCLQILRLISQETIIHYQEAERPTTLFKCRLDSPDQVRLEKINLSKP